MHRHAIYQGAAATDALVLLTTGLANMGAAQMQQGHSAKSLFTTQAAERHTLRNKTCAPQGRRRGTRYETKLVRREGGGEARDRK